MSATTLNLHFASFPVPRTLNDRTKIGVRCFPSELLVDAVNGSAKHSRITFATGSIFDVQLLSRHFLDHPADFEHRMCLASADIEGSESRLIHALEREQMSVGDV